MKQKALLTSVVWLIVAAVALAGQQPDRARTEALARRAADRLHALQQEADRLASEVRTLLGDLRRLEVERQIKAEEFRAVTDEASAVAGEIAAIDEQARQLERQETAERPELAQRIVELYKLGQGRYLRLLLSISDVRRVGQASRMVAAVAERDRDRIASHQTRLAVLKSSRTALAERGTRLAALKSDAERAQTASQRALDARNVLIRDVDRRRDLNAQLAGELQSAQQKLQLTLRDLGAGAAAVEPVALPLRPFRGDLDWPVQGSVRLPFGRTASNGVDIAAGEGTPVRAIHDGAVAFAGPFAGFGNLVIVDHGAQAFSLYGNLLQIDVSRGARIDRGQGLGLSGASPTGAPGLYFELRVDGRPVDPVQWLRKR